MVMRAVLEDSAIPERESLPVMINDDLWESWTHCWDRDTRKRPSAKELIELLPGVLERPSMLPRLKIDAGGALVTQEGVGAGLPTPVSKTSPAEA